MEYTQIQTASQARRVAVSEYGSKCVVPFAFFLPEHNTLETVTLTNEQKEIYARIRPRVMELRAVLFMLELLENQTWMYALGFRATTETNPGRIVTPNIDSQIEAIPHPASWHVLARAIGVEFDDSTDIREIVYRVITSQLVSDMEQGINYVFEPSDITGSGSDALDPDGRIRLQEFFGLSRYCTNLNERMVAIFDDIRAKNPKR
jgi:hypothetical protein